MRMKMMHLDSVKHLRIWPLERIWCLKFPGLVYTSRLSVRIEPLEIYVYSMRRVRHGKSFLHNNVQLCQFLSLVKFCEMWTWASCLVWLRMIWLHTSLPYLFLPFCCNQGAPFSRAESFCVSKGHESRRQAVTRATLFQQIKSSVRILSIKRANERSDRIVGISNFDRPIILSLASSHLFLSSTKKHSNMFSVTSNLVSSSKWAPLGLGLMSLFRQKLFT